MLREKGVVSKKAAALQICRVSRLGRRVVAETFLYIMFRSFPIFLITALPVRYISI